MKNTRARNEALGQAAQAYCAAHSISAHPIARAHCVAFATAQGCTVETARRHLTHALNYTQRGPDAVPPGWGGMRPGAGRRHKSDEPEPARGIIAAARNFVPCTSASD